MPVFDDILDNKVLGREYKRGLEEGRRQAMMSLIRSLVNDRSGAVQSPLESRLCVMTLPELESAALRIAQGADPNDLLD